MLSWLFLTSGFAQQKIKLQIVPVDSVAYQVVDKEELDYEVADSIAALKKLKKFANNWLSKGYLSSSFDSIQFDSTSMKAFFFLGQKFSLKNVSFDSVPEHLLQKAGVLKKVSKEKSLSFTQFLKLRETIVEHYENNGYPFARVLIDSLSFDSFGAKGELRIVQNPFVNIDSVIIKGNPKISRKYLNYYLNVKKGEPYNQAKIDGLSKSIEKLPYLIAAKPAEIEFREGKADIYLYLKNKPANYFNGIIGFASGTEENPDFQITGDLSLVLVNAFKIGEEVNIYWDKYSANSQNLKLGFQFPYLFFLPVGIDFRFGLEKHELDYLNTDLFGAVSYSFSAKNTMNVYLAQKNSYLINNGEDVTGNYNESSRFTLGMTFLLDQTDYRLNPRKGFFIEASSGYGNRATANVKSDLIDFEVQLEYFLKLGKMGTLALLNHSAGMFSDFEFYENELYKIGGNNSLRGFDELSIFASFYSIFSVEPRLLIGKNSAIYLFGDIAWYESKQIDNQVSDTPYGFGLGINIDTKAGIFKLSYALGKQFDNPMKFSDSKVHFGFSARF
jgi:outer membrane protein assembly factor BamA